jgi:hypothetical protein
MTTRSPDRRRREDRGQVPGSEEPLGHLVEAVSVATITLSMSASLSAVDMNQLCLGCTKTPRGGALGRPRQRDLMVGLAGER